MVTRLYFPVTTAAEVSPSPDSGWEDVADLLRRLLENTKGSSAITIGTSVAFAVGADAIDRQYVSKRMDGGISFSAATVKMQLMAREFNAGDNTTSRLGIRIVSEDGSIVRQVLLAVGQYGPNAEFINNATCRNKAFADGDIVAGTYTTVIGDRLVVEIGYSDIAGATPVGASKYGENATDLPENETQTTDGAGWIEFSNNIIFPTNFITKVVNETEEISDVVSKVPGVLRVVNETENISELENHKLGVPNEEVVFGGLGATSTTGPKYATLTTWGGDWRTNEVDATSVIPGICTLKNFRVRVGSAPGSGNNYTFTIYKNGSATSVVVVISDAETEDVDATNTLSLARGDKVSIQASTNLAQLPSDSVWGILLVHLYPKETFLMASADNGTNDRFLHFSGAINNGNIEEKATKAIFPQLGLLRSLIVKIKSSIGSGTIGRTVRKNGVNTDLTATVTSGDSAEDNAHGVLYSPGTDVLNGIAINTGSPGVGANWQMSGLVYDLFAGVDKSQVIIGISFRGLSVSGIRYHALPHLQVSNDLSTDNLRTQRLFTASKKLSKFYVRTDDFLPAGVTCVVTLRKNGVDTAITVTLSDSVKEASDLTNQVTFDASDVVSIKTDINISGAVSTRFIEWAIIAETVDVNIKKVINETENIEEQDTKLIQVLKVVNETEEISDVQNKQVGLIRAIDETENISELENHNLALSRVVNETIEIAEAVNKIVAAQGAIIKIINETENISELENHIVAFGGILKIVNEVNELLDVDIKTLGVVKMVNETESISDNPLRIRGIVQMANETENISELENHARGLGKIIIEIEETTETDFSTLGIVRSVIEAVQIIEAVNQFKGLARSVTETEQIPEATNHKLDLKRVIDEIQEIIETIVHPIAKVIDEIQNISDTSNKALGSVQVANETENISETSNKNIGIVRVIDDPLSIIEAFSRIVGISRVIIEVENLSENFVKNLGLVKIANEIQNIVDVISSIPGIIKAINENETIIEAENHAMSLLRVVDEILHISDAANHLRALLRVINDTLNINEILVRLRPQPGLIFEVTFTNPKKEYVESFTDPKKAYNNSFTNPKKEYVGDFEA